MKNNYWKKRFIEEEALRDKRANTFIKEMHEEYDKSLIGIEKEINNWYQRLATNNGVTLQDAKKLLNNKELKEFKWGVEDYIRHGQENEVNKKWIKELENASARHHINKYESLKVNIQNEVENLYSKRTSKMNKYATDVFEDSYYKGAYNTSMQLGFGKNLYKLDTNKINKVIHKPWAVDGLNFSDRIWKDKESLINKLHTGITQNLIRGENPKRLISEIAREFEIKKSSAERLVYTETAAYHSAAQKDVYRDLEVEQYEILSTLDSKTSEICRELDGKIFSMSDYDVGVTAPPFHVRCRTLTVPYEDDFESTRLSKLDDGTYVKVPENMKYDEWKDKFVFENSIQTKSPMNCKNYSEIFDYFEQEYGIIISEELKSLHFESVRESLEGVDIVAKEFPLAKNKLTNLKVEKGGIMAASRNGTLYFNPSKYNDPKNLSNVIMGNETGYFPKNTGILETGSHEMGHLLESALIDMSGTNFKINDWNKSIQAKRVISEACKSAKKTVEGKGKLNNVLKSEISRYARENDSECMAEAVSDYIANKDNASILSKEIWRILKKELGGK